VVLAIWNKLFAPAQHSLDGVAGREPSKNGRHGSNGHITPVIDSELHEISSIWLACNVAISMHKTITCTKRYFDIIAVEFCKWLVSH